MRTSLTWERYETLLARHIKETYTDLSERTLMDYHFSLAKFEKFAKRRMVNRDLAVEYVQLLKDQGCPRASIIKQVKPVARMLCWCVRLEILDKSPFSLVRIPVKHKPKEIKLISVQEYEGLMKYHHADIRWMFCLCYHTGLSFIDAALLQWTNVDLENMMISGKRRKTGTPFRVPIIEASDLHKMLLILNANREDQKDVHPSDSELGIEFVCNYLAARVKVSCWSYGINSHIDKACKVAGIKRRIRSHDFRRDFCSRIANSGGNPSVAMVATGHRLYQQFNAYVKVSDDGLRDLVFQAQQTQFK
jgi:integrase